MSAVEGISIVNFIHLQRHEPWISCFMVKEAVVVMILFYDQRNTAFPCPQLGAKK
jgi:hypothetical protein